MADGPYNSGGSAAVQPAAGAAPAAPDMFEETCPTCGRVFRGRQKFGVRSNLKRHMQLHENTRSHVCALCDATFTTSGNLKRHISLAHQSPSLRPTVPRFACAHCEKEFLWKNSLTHHMRQRHPEVVLASASPASGGGGAAPVPAAAVLEWACGDCGATLSSRTKLNRHKREHCPFRADVALPPAANSGEELTRRPSHKQVLRQRRHERRARVLREAATEDDDDDDDNNDDDVCPEAALMPNGQPPTPAPPPAVVFRPLGDLGGTAALDFFAESDGSTSGGGAEVAERKAPTRRGRVVGVPAGAKRKREVQAAVHGRSSDGGSGSESSESMVAIPTSPHNVATAADGVDGAKRHQQHQEEEEEEDKKAWCGGSNGLLFASGLPPPHPAVAAASAVVMRERPSLILRHRSSKGAMYACPSGGCFCTYAKRRSLLRHIRVIHADAAELLLALIADTAAESD